MADSVLRVAVASALPEEIGALTERVDGGREELYGGQAVTVGRLGAVRVMLLHTGTGRKRARTGIAALLDREDVDVLFYVGVAGALDPSLCVGALFVPSVVQDERGRAAPPPDDPWRDRALRVTGGLDGTLVTVDRVVTRPEEKARLWAALDGNTAAAIDMETVAVAHAAAEHDVPYVSVRVVSDAADEPLPDLLKDAQRDDGSIDRTRVMRDVVWSPGAVPALVRMRRRVQSAAGVLAEVIPQVVRHAESPA